MSTNPSDTPGVAPGESGDTSSSAKEKSQQAAGAAAEEGQRLAGTAKHEAAKVADEARDQLRGLVGQASSQLDDQSRTQKSRLAETLHGIGGDLDDMAGSSEGSGPARQVVQQVARQAHELADHLDSRDPQELLEDVRRFARRRPAAFLIGAALAGVAVGRFTRGARAASQGHSGYPSAGQPAHTPARPSVPSHTGTQQVGALGTTGTHGVAGGTGGVVGIDEEREVGTVDEFAVGEYADATRPTPSAVPGGEPR